MNLIIFYPLIVETKDFLYLTSSRKQQMIEVWNNECQYCTIDGVFKIGSWKISSTNFRNK